MRILHQELVPHINTLWWSCTAWRFSSGPLNKGIHTPFPYPFLCFLPICWVSMEEGGYFLSSPDAWYSLTSSAATFWLPSLIIYWMSHIDNSSFWQIVKDKPSHISWTVPWQHDPDPDTNETPRYVLIFLRWLWFPFFSITKGSRFIVYLAFTIELRNLHLRDRLAFQIFKFNHTYFLCFNLHLLIYLPLLLHQCISCFFWMPLYFCIMP